MKLLFLDIDGCLNTHSWDQDAKSSTLDRDKVERLNYVLNETGARIVVSSAWRYMVHGGAMTLGGFDYLLRTHGVIADAVVGITRMDTMIDKEAPKPDERGEQISDWLMNDNRWSGHPYAVIDDLDAGITAAGHPFVQCDGKVGMTDADAERLIELLGAAE